MFVCFGDYVVLGSFRIVVGIRHLLLSDRIDILFDSFDLVMV